MHHDKLSFLTEVFLPWSDIDEGMTHVFLWKHHPSGPSGNGDTHKMASWIPSPIYIRHHLNVPNGMWKFPTKPWFLRRCLTWGRDYWEDGDEPWNFGAPYVQLNPPSATKNRCRGDEIIWFVVVTKYQTRKSNLAMLMPFLMAEDGTINNQKSDSFIVHISIFFACEIIYVPAFAAAV